MLGIVDRFLGEAFARAAAGTLDRDFKTQLQELAQSRLRATPRYRVVAEHGPDHSKTFEVETDLRGEVVGRGAGRSKKDAEQAAAKLALDALSRRFAPRARVAASRAPAPAEPRPGGARPPPEASRRRAEASAGGAARRARSGLAPPPKRPRARRAAAGRAPRPQGPSRKAAAARKGPRAPRERAVSICPTPGRAASIPRMTRTALALALAVALAAPAAHAQEKKKMETPVYATFKTSLGDIVVKLLPEKAPKTVENFVGLAEGTKEWKDPRSGQTVKKPLYDGTVFHRVIPQFMIQGGDPLGNGTGRPRLPLRRRDRAGQQVLEAGPPRDGERRARTPTARSSSSPRSPTPWLDRGHTIFGEVVKGFELVPKIVAAGNGKVKLDKVVITRGAQP